MTTNGNVVASSWDEARQLGQLFMMGFDGTTINDQVRVLIEKYHVGSILLTAKNLKSAAQTTQLVLDLQTLAHNAGHPVPLLIAIDQENGGVNSLFDEIYIRQFPSAMGIAATGSKQLAKYTARATAQELHSCGVNWILGPVMDVLNTGRNQPLSVRSFGVDTTEVSAFVVESMKGYQEGGVATCGKHFPSYGNLEFFGAPTDVPTITDSLEHLIQTALIPFRQAISQGLDAMIVGGVAMASPNMNVMHACLSEEVVKNLLRGEMQFDGVVVSECLEMEALSRNIGISGGTVMAFNAGCDIILTCRTLSVQEEAINGLRTGLDNGMIERMRVQESVRRVLSLKNRYTSWEKAFAPTGTNHLGRLQPLHTNLSTTAYNKSITIVRDQKRYLPLSKIMQENDELLVLTPLVRPLPASAASIHVHGNSRSALATDTLDSIQESSILSGEQVFREFGKSIARARNGKVSHTSYTANGLRPMHEKLLERAKAVIVVTADAGRNMYQNAFAKHVSLLCKVERDEAGQPRERPCIVVAVSSPFDFATDASIGTYVCTYDFTETALQALVKILYGELSAVGVLPGTSSQVLKASQARQQWLVEGFNEERDSIALDALLSAAQNDVHSNSNLLDNTTSATFLLRNPDIDEAHFVVRNSSTKEIFGFCATYFIQSSNIGHVAAIVVDPGRRRQSIGHSLHERAIRALQQKQSAQVFKLGSRMPGVFAGVPKSDLPGHKKLRQWFSKLGWSMGSTRVIYSMSIRDLSSWVAPEGLGKALTNPDIKYDLIHGLDYSESILEHVRQNSHSDVQTMYRMALSNKEGCAIIRAKKSSDSSLLGSVILFRSSSKLGPYVPGVQNAQTMVGALSAPVLALGIGDQATILQGLMLLGTRQLKRQGISTVLIDYVDDNATISSLKRLGFSIYRSFDEISCDPISWTIAQA